MKLELFTLCDFAKGEPTGKLYVIGTFDHIFAGQMPSPAPACAIAARLRFERSEQGQKSVSISFAEADGEKVIPDISMTMTIQVPPGESTMTANLVVMLPQVNLPRYGEYSIDLSVDSSVEGSVPLYVRRAEHAPPPWQPSPRP